MQIRASAGVKIKRYGARGQAKQLRPASVAPVPREDAIRDYRDLNTSFDQNQIEFLDSVIMNGD